MPQTLQDLGHDETASHDIGFFADQVRERFGLRTGVAVEEVDPYRRVDQNSHRRFRRSSMSPIHWTLPRRSRSCRRRLARAKRRSASFTTSVFVRPSETFMAASSAPSSRLSVVRICLHSGAYPK